jgi:prepilin-type N-terminal cleavage/methylation domain-containing protein
LRPPTQRRGFTLLEQLVSLTILVILLVLGDQVLVPCLHLWSLNQAEAALEQDAMVLGSRMASEVCDSDPSSFTFSTTPVNAMSFLSTGAPKAQALGFDPQSGKPMWQYIVVYYFDSPNRILYRKTWPNPALSAQNPPLVRTLPSTTAFALTQQELAQLCTTTNGTEQAIGYDVEKFSGSLVASTIAQISLNMLDDSTSTTLLLSKPVNVQVEN